MPALEPDVVVSVSPAPHPTASRDAPRSLEREPAGRAATWARPWGIAALALVTVGAASRVEANPPAHCRNEYSEDLATLSAAARDMESRTPSYSYAVRTSATYECVSYAADGELRKTREVATAHGTAFGYRRDGDHTLLLTNAHVADWPAVTDRGHPVDGVPAGCKRVADSLKIVDDDHDRYAADDIALARVVSDPQLDVAILRAPVKLQVLPWKIGHSAGLASRAVVEVKGFPLGQFQATNVGKVISAFDHDDQGEWNHDDFVVDALLSSGGSGSPVLAVSCKTGEFELVGIFHAHYSEGSALNVVVAIDQVHALMTTLRRAAPPAALAGNLLDAEARARLISATPADQPMYFPFGPLVAQVRAQPDGGLVFQMFPGEFPRATHPVFGVEDAPAIDGFGQLGAVYFGDAQGLRAYDLAADAETEQLVVRTLDALRRNALALLDYRAAAASSQQSRLASAAMERQRRALDRMLEAQHDDAQSLVELANRLAPPRPRRPADPTVHAANQVRR